MNLDFGEVWVGVVNSWVISMKMVFVSQRNGEIIEDKERKKEGLSLVLGNVNIWQLVRGG